MIMNLWIKGAYINASVNELIREKYRAPPEKRRFFYGFFSLFGKAPVCGAGKQGSIPEETQRMNGKMVNCES